MAGTHIRLTHGYEFFLTVGRDIEPDGDIDMSRLPDEWVFDLWVEMRE